MSGRTDRLLPWLALASFIPPALFVVWASMVGRDGVAVAGLVWLLATGALFVWWKMKLRHFECDKTPKR